jgi:hypothetical protein
MGKEMTMAKEPMRQKHPEPMRPLNWNAIRRRLKLVQRVAAYTGHCTITDEEIRKAMFRNKQRNFHDFVERYGLDYGWVELNSV